MLKKTLLVSVIASTLLVGCDQKQTATPSPSPIVTATQTQMVNFQPQETYVGRVVAVEDTDITAQVSGYLENRHFKEGQMVEKGQLLYTIEPSSFVAQVAIAKANVAQAKAAVKKAQLDFNRGKRLLPKGSISQSEFDSLTANLLGVEAQLEAGLAQLQVAEVDLSHTQITAPFSGKISRSYVSKGDLVSGSTGALATLVSVDPINAQFNLSERERLTFQLDQPADATNGSMATQIEVQIKFENDVIYSQIGQLDYIGNRINTDTGTMEVKATFSNPAQQLLPGQHVRIMLRQKNSVNALAIPRRAIQTDLEGNYVMVLTADNIAERRNVQLGRQVPEGIIISDGLKEKEQVIVSGLQRIRNGMPVQLSDDEK